MLEARDLGAAGGDGATGVDTSSAAPSDAESEVSVALDGSSLTLQTVDSADARLVRAYLFECGVELYAATTVSDLRSLATKLLRSPAGAIIKPAHPVLHRHSRPARHLRLESPELLRGAQLFALVQSLKEKGAVFDCELRNTFMPFTNVQRRGYKLYDAGRVRAGGPSLSHAHSHHVTAQLARFEPPGAPAVDAFIFRMNVHASMKNRDYVTMLALAMTDPPSLLLAPNSVCDCPVGLECSHMYCLAIVLEVMQTSASHREFFSTVLVFDKKRAPSGAACWWPDAFYCGVGTRRETQARLNFTESAASSHVSGGVPGYHHSDDHRCELTALLAEMKFRRGALAGLVRSQYGTAVAPLPVRPVGGEPTPPPSFAPSLVSSGAPSPARSPARHARGEDANGACELVHVLPLPHAP